MDPRIAEVESLIESSNQRSLARQEAGRSAVRAASERTALLRRPSVLREMPVREAVRAVKEATSRTKPDERKMAAAAEPVQAARTSTAPDAMGTSASDGVRCRNCGNPLNREAVFCKHCGMRVEVVSSPRPVVSEACSCGEPWREGSKFCRRCGSMRPAAPGMKGTTQMPDARRCPDGHENRPDAVFCKTCGKKI